MLNQPQPNKMLIVTADDLGFSSEINETIMNAYLRGIVTTAGIMVNAAGTHHAAKLLRTITMPIGLHLNLFDGQFDENEEGLFGEEGRLNRLIQAREGEERIFLPHSMVNKIFREFWLQLCAFRELFKKDPEHLSYHGPLHLLPEVFDAYARFAQEEHIPFRHGNPRHWHYETNSERDLNQEYFLNMFNTMPEGIMEISLHPSHQLKVLTDKELRDEIVKQNITLISFAHL